MKTRNKIYILLGVAFLMLGAKALKDNTLIIGDGVNTDKEIVLDIGAGTSNPRFIWNSASNSLQFTNDNSDILDIGSGSGGGGGGINVVEEGDFEREASIDDWVNTGTGVFARTTTAANVGNGGGAASYDAALATEKITSAAFLVPNVIADTLCIAEMWYKGGGTADLTMRVIDGSDVLVDGSELVISDAVTTFKRAYTTFICPTEGESVKFQLEAAGNADIIYIDDVFIGTKGLTRGAAGGWKIYDPAVIGFDATPAGWALVDGQYIPYKDPKSGLWRLRFNIVATATTATSISATITGVVFKSGINQAIAVTAGSNIASRGFATNNTGTVFVGHATSDINFFVSGDVALDSKPTWADFDGTVNLLNNSVIGSNAKFKMTGISNTAIGTLTRPIPFKTIVHNVGGFTHDGLGVITVPVDGYYRVYAKVKFSAVVAQTIDAELRLDNVNRAVKNYPANVTNFIESSAEIFLNAGDTVIFRKNNTSALTAVDQEAVSFIEISRIPDISSESALGFAIADSVNYGLIKTNRSQVKILAADVTTDVTAITFNNLVIGKRYEVYAQVAIQNSGGGGAAAEINHNGVKLGEFQYNPSAIAAGSGVTGGVKAEFTATANTVTLDGSSLNANEYIAGNNTRGETWMQIKELNNVETVETTDFN